MGMAEYILSILRINPMVVLSWGFNAPRALPNDMGLIFNVDGFKYKGEVKILYNEGADLFSVTLANGKQIEGVYFDQLVEVIDNLVEKTDDYDNTVMNFYKLK